jgi:Leucine-rich repeat (LRR) protein
MIIRLPQSSEKYLGFTQLTVTNLMIESIQPDAQFLFTNLKRLDFLSNSNMSCLPLEALKSILDLFIASGSQLEFIKVDLNFLKRHNGQLKEFINYPIKSITLSSHGENNPEWLKTSLSEISSSMNGLTEIKTALLQSISADLMQSFPNLEKFDLSENKIITIEPNAFVKASKLTHLNLSNTKLECLTEATFDGLVNLRSLNLSGSKPKAIHSSVFKKLVKLEELDLSQNKGLFMSGGLPYFPVTLKRLNLSQCCINKCEPHSFNSIAYLEKLDLSVNNIAKFESSGCVPRILDLTRNNLNILKFSPGNHLLPRLEQLHLSRNRLNCANFDILINLNLLDISDNRVTQFYLPKCSPRVFIASINKLTNLAINGSKIEQLDLTNNVLANSINAGFKTGFTCLKELTLSENKIEKLDANVFSQMRSLTKLTITKNSINELSSEAFQGLSSLEELSVSLRSFECLKPGIFKDLSKLQTLQLINADADHLI